MQKYLLETLNYWQYKVIAGVFALVFSDEFFMLICIFLALELLDIFTRWLAQSRACWRALYPNTDAGLWRLVKFMWTAHKWRFINSSLWRSGFCDKMLLYLLLLLTAVIVDSALSLGHAPRMVTTIIVTVLSLTEALSVIENLAEATDNDVVKIIKEKLKSKVINNATNK